MLSKTFIDPVRNYTCVHCQCYCCMCSKVLSTKLAVLTTCPPPCLTALNLTLEEGSNVCKLRHKMCFNYTCQIFQVQIIQRLRSLVLYVRHFHTGYSIFHCNSMKHKVIHHWITMEYAVFLKKMPHIWMGLPNLCTIIVSTGFTAAVSITIFRFCFTCLR